MNQFLTNLWNAIAGTKPQGWLFDSTVYCRLDGLDPAKIKQHNFAGMLIQTGRGDEIVSTLQDQIDVAEECELPWAGWHIPDPNDGSMRYQAELVAAQPRVKGHLLIGDLEPRKYGDWSTCVTPDQGHDFLKALADVSGRASWGYSNPDILINRFKMPQWVYDFDWWIAQYPSSKWKTFEEFLAYYAWKYPSYFKDNTEFRKRIKIWQWTQWGKAQLYYAATTLPDGGKGIQSGDLDIAMMTFGETQSVLAVEEEPIPEPSDVGKRLNVLEINQDYILAAITDLMQENEEVHAKLAEFEQRFEELEVSGVGNKKTVYVTGDKGTMYEQYDENKSWLSVDAKARTCYSL